MALRVWLPLNGNLNNQGLSDIQIVNNGATVDNSGKIGSCYSFDGADDYISLSNLNFMPEILPKEWTICFWIYNNDGGDRSIYFSNYQIGGVGDVSFGFEKTTGELLRIVFNSGKFDNTISACSIDVGKWTHLTISKNTNHLVSVYKNGNLVASYTNSNCASNGTLYYLGRDNRTGATTLNGKLNDFRIYDECLSQRQIKEISKGLVAHYKLEGPGANPNLLKNTNVNSGDGNYWQTTTSVFDETARTITITTNQTRETVVGHKINGIKSNQTYTMSAYAKSNGKVTSMEFFCYNSSIQGIKSKSFTNLTTEFQKYTWTFTTASDIDYLTGSTIRVDNNGTKESGVDATLIVKDVMLEEGDKATSWIPNTQDALYNALGYNNTIARDSSGNGYHGAITGSLDYNSDSARYNGCTKFSDSSFIKINQPLNWEARQVSFSFWFNMTGDAQNKYSAIFIPNGTPTAANGLWLSINTESVGLWAYRSSFKPNYHKAGALIETIGWHHAVFVWDAGVSKWYLDGVQYGSTVDTWATETLSSALNYTIGDSYTGTKWSGTPFTGRLSDFRIYATALTADDILTLYKTSGIIDNEGNVYAYEFKEE